MAAGLYGLISGEDEVLLVCPRYGGMTRFIFFVAVGPEPTSETEGWLLPLPGSLPSLSTSFTKGGKGFMPFSAAMLISEVERC